MTGVVNVKTFRAQDDESQIVVYGEGSFMSTLKFKNKALVLLGEHTISYRTEELSSAADVTVKQM